MATQTDRLARIAAEGFTMIDELYGRPNRLPVSNAPSGIQGQGPQSSYQGNKVPVPRMAESLSSQDAAKKYGGCVIYKNQQGGY